MYLPAVQRLQWQRSENRLCVCGTDRVGNHEARDDFMGFVDDLLRSTRGRRCWPTSDRTRVFSALDSSGG